MPAKRGKIPEFTAKANQATPKPKAMPAMSPGDVNFARMAQKPNPDPQPWMADPSKLPKRPPGR